MDKKITIQIKNRLTGAVLFEYTKENNTIKDTLAEAIKQGANLCGADLHGADLGGFNLRYVDLHFADIHLAKLDCADLSCSDLSGADLRFADLRLADLSYANLYNANIHYADLCGANLYGVDIDGISLYGANLRKAKNIPYIPLACPTDGAFIGWKKIEGEWLVKLRIPEDARRSSATTQKCRCDKAEVLAITDLNGNKPVKEITNYRRVKTRYKVGEMVYPDDFDDDRWNECSNGIHFFVNKQDAINYEVVLPKDVYKI